MRDGDRRAGHTRGVDRPAPDSHRPPRPAFQPEPPGLEGSKRNLVAAMAVAATVAAFVGDLMVPLGVAAGVAHIVGVALTRPVAHARFTLAIGLASIVCVVISWFASPPGGVRTVVMMNRALSVVAIIVTTFAVYRSILAERVAWQAQEDFVRTLKQLPVATIVAGRDGRIAFANDAALRLLGYSADEMGQLSVDALVPDAYREDHPEKRAKYMAAPRARRMGANRDLTALRKDGSEVPVEIGLDPYRGAEGEDYVIAAIIDLTERKRLIERFRSTFESAPIALLLVDEAGYLNQVNTAAEKLFEYERHELLGTSVDRLVPKELAPRHPELRAAYMREPRRVHLGAPRVLHARTKFDEEFPVELGLSPAPGPEGMQVIVAVFDMRERHALERALRLANDELESRVAERTADLAARSSELARSNEALEESNLELNQFAYIASHDLQTPLRSIAGFVQLLGRRYGDQIDDEGREWIQHTVEGVQRLKSMIEDLLTYSRVESRSRPFVRVELDDVLADVQEMLQASVSDSDGTIDADPLPAVRGDRSQLVQLFLNLVGNGLKYNEAPQPRVHIHGRKDGDMVEICVEDNGIGIGEAHREQIFEIFRRLHSKDEYPGTGIGLALCRRVTLRHGGDIEVESVPRGRIDLPR